MLIHSKIYPLMFYVFQYNIKENHCVKWNDFSQWEISDMNLFIWCDKLENYSCSGTISIFPTHFPSFKFSLHFLLLNHYYYVGFSKHLRNIFKFSHYLLPFFFFLWWKKRKEKEKEKKRIEKRKIRGGKCFELFY